MLLTTRMLTLLAKPVMSFLFILVLEPETIAEKTVPSSPIFVNDCSIIFMGKFLNSEAAIDAYIHVLLFRLFILKDSAHEAARIKTKILLVHIVACKLSDDV